MDKALIIVKINPSFDICHNIITNIIIKSKKMSYTFLKLQMVQGFVAKNNTTKGKCFQNTSVLDYATSAHPNGFIYNKYCAILFLNRMTQEERSSMQNCSNNVEV